MKLNNNNKQQLLLLVGLLFCFSCNETTNPVANISTEGPKAEKKLFPFYKDIELKPGYGFEIISWGKGVDSIGAYQILMSDSLRNNYKSVSSDRHGILTDAWNMDLDNDGNPELYIQLLSKKNELDLNVYEFSSGSFNKINFPSLTAKQKKGYIGNDKFFIKNGDLFRSYQQKDVSDSSKIDTKTLQYKLSNNNFSAVEAKPE